MEFGNYLLDRKKFKSNLIIKGRPCKVFYQQKGTECVKNLFEEIFHDLHKNKKQLIMFMKYFMTDWFWQASKNSVICRQLKQFIILPKKFKVFVNFAN